MLEISDKNFDSEVIEKKVYALRTIHTPRTGRVLAYWLMGILLFMLVCLFLPWQQNVEGTGKVTALSPQDRPQEVNTAIAGRIKEWRIQEGQFVKKGDTLVVLEEIKADYFDPELLKRLEEQLQAKSQGIGANQQKIQALNALIQARQSGLQLSLQKARNKYQQATLKVRIDSADFEAEKLALQIAERQYGSYNDLFQANNNGDIPLISRTEWEKRRQKLQEVQAKLIGKENKLLVSRNELINARIELNSLEAEYADKISKAQSDLSSSLATLADKEGDLSKLRNYYANMSIRNQQYCVLAPQDGYIVKALKSGVGETVKETNAICTIQPSEPRVAVELYVKAMDVPLISKGRTVRLEFDGWPALQVSGWPSVAVGTFGGIIQVIDLVDSKEGKYRILVTPDPREPWPKQVRVGSGVYGWVMLDDVPVWYEIWRQLNGFPPSLYEEPSEEDNKEKKSDKKIKIKVKS
ncbi:MAG: biotin/lipoyl-binding protein [Microscillaceae bacterium]